MTSFDSLSGEKRGLFHFENLTHLLSYRSLDELLTEALSWLVNTFRATGGAILYASTLVKSVRLGDLSAAAEQKARTHTLSDGTPGHSFRTLLEELSTIVRNTRRTAQSAEKAPTFMVVTQPNPVQQRALKLLDSITV